MTKLLALILTVLCVRFCTGVISRDTAVIAETEPIKTEVAAETAPEITLPTTTAPTEPALILETSEPRFESGFDSEETALEVFGCRMYTLDNGCTRFEVDFRTAEGLQAIAFAYAGENHRPAFWYEGESLTTGSKETLVFEMETEVLNQTNGPDIHFQNRSHESVSYILIYPFP